MCVCVRVRVCAHVGLCVCARCGQTRWSLVIEGFPNEPIVAAIVKHIKDGWIK